MIIGNYSVNSTATREYSKETTAKATVTTKAPNGKANSANAPETVNVDGLMPQDTVELTGKDRLQTAGQNMMSKLKDIMEQTAKENTERLNKIIADSERRVAASGRMNSAGLVNPESAKIDLLAKMLEAMTGKKHKSFDPEKVFKNENNTSLQDVFNNISKSMAARQQQPVKVMQEQTVSLEMSSFESESFTYSAQGLINTADGRTISVDVNLSMSRETAEYMKLDETVMRETMSQNLCDPLVINYAGGAASLTGQKYDFDITMDGSAEKISFAGEGSGFLALDKNGDGKIGDGSELFGPQTGSGFGELRAYDKDGNNWIDEADDIYDKLVVYTKDSNGNDQMFKLKDLDIGAIYLGDMSTEFSMMDSGNAMQGQMRSTSFFLKDSGGAGVVSHIDLAY